MPIAPIAPAAAMLCSADEIERSAGLLLDLRPCAVVEYRLRRDVLLESPISPSMQALRRDVQSSSGAIELTREQKADGSWGRFHSMDSSIRARFVTSERAIERALALGLDRSSPILSRAADYMTACLRGESDWSDREEKPEAWFEGKRVITAAMLSLVDPGNPETLPVWDLWVQTAEGALFGGEYSLARENASFRQLTGVAFKKGYLHSMYALCLLGSRGPELPAALSAALLRWIWGSRAGIGYLEADMRQPNLTRLEPWLKSLEILSGFPGWQGIAKEGLDWLWQQRQANGLWDFGRGMRTGFGFPLSDNWVARGNRMVDHSTRILALLTKSLY